MAGAVAIWDRSLWGSWTSGPVQNAQRDDVRPCGKHPWVCLALRRGPHVSADVLGGADVTGCRGHFGVDRTSQGTFWTGPRARQGSEDVTEIQSRTFPRGEPGGACLRAPLTGRREVPVGCPPAVIPPLALMPPAAALCECLPLLVPKTLPPWLPSPWRTRRAQRRLLSRAFCLFPGGSRSHR